MPCPGTSAGHVTEENGGQVGQPGPSGAQVRTVGKPKDNKRDSIPMVPMCGKTLSLTAPSSDAVTDTLASKGNRSLKNRVTRALKRRSRSSEK